MSNAQVVPYDDCVRIPKKYVVMACICLAVAMGIIVLETQVLVLTIRHNFGLADTIRDLEKVVQLHVDHVGSLGKSVDGWQAAFQQCFNTCNTRITGS